MKRIAVLFTTVLVLLGNAYAADITVDVNTDGTLAALNQPNDGPCSLREAIQNANDGAQTYDDCEAGSAGADNIKFSGVSSITIVNSDISVNSEITIDATMANPITLAGGGNQRIFTLAGSGNLHLKFATLQNGYSSGSGGAILQNGTSSTVDCLNSTFKNNKADNDGGAIDSVGAIISNACSFENNQAGNNGGAIRKSGGSILSPTLVINASNFADNLSGTDPAGQDNGGAGGAIHLGQGFASITSTRFNKNKAKSGKTSSDHSGGGAIRTDGILNIVASVFAGNEVNQGSDAMAKKKWHGGAILNESNGVLAITYSHFGETPTMLPPPFNTLTLPNKVTADEGNGGAVYSLGDMLILGTSFIGNSSQFNGGAVVNASTADSSLISTVSGLVFDGANIANSTFSDNSAGNFGGALYNYNLTVDASDNLMTLTNVTIADNMATSGGGIYNQGDGDNFGLNNDEVLLQNVILSNNSAANPANANCGGGTVASESVNNVTFGGACPAASAVTGNPVLSGTPELSFTLSTIVTYTLPLGAGSSALGNGNAAICALPPVINLDQRALPLGIRPQGDANCDVGAYESGAIGMPSPTPTRTPSNTATNTATSTSTFTPSNTPTNTATRTPTLTATNTATSTNTFTPSNTPTSTNTFTPSNTPTQTNTFTPSNTPTITVTATPTNTGTITNTPTNTRTFTPSNTPTNTRTGTPSNTPTNTRTFTPSNTPTNTSTFTPSNTPTITLTASPTNTGTLSPTTTATNTPTNTATATATESQTETPTATATSTATGTLETATPTATGTVPQNITPSGSGDLGCNETDIQDKQFILDGQAAKQKHLILRAKALSLKAGASTPQKTALNKIVQSATMAYVRMWSGIWSYQRKIVKCSNTVLCTDVDISVSAKAFQKDSDLMVSLLSDAVKVLRKVSSNKKAGDHLLRQMKTLSDLNFATLAAIPSTSSFCNNS